QAWGAGQKERRNGAVLFVFTQDHKMFIQVGYGLEGALPDATAFDITERHIKPLFRAGNYEAGLATGIDLIFNAIRGEYKGSGKTFAEQQHSGGPFKLLPFLIFIIVLIIISRVTRRLGAYSYSSRGGGPIFIPSGGGWSSGGGGGGGGFSGFSGGGGRFGGGGGGFQREQKSQERNFSEKRQARERCAETLNLSRKPRGGVRFYSVGGV